VKTTRRDITQPKEVRGINNNIHCLHINTKDGEFELDGVSIIDSTINCTIRYQGHSPAVVDLTLLADVVLDDLVEVRARSIKEQG